MNMKIWTVFLALFLSGLLCGLGIAWILDGPPVVDDSSEVVTATVGEPDEWRDERTELLSRISSQSKRIASIELELKRASELQTENQQEAIPEISEEERREIAQKRFAERMSERLDGRIERMATAYGLNAVQQAAIKQAFLDRSENQRARRNGEDVDRFDMDAALSEVMTEEQFASYLEETQENIYNRAEMMATTQTVRLGQVLDLHPDVESMVYDTLNLTSQEMMIALQEGKDFNFRQVTNERLRTILTEEQMQVAEETIRFGRGGGGGGGRGQGNFPGP